MKYYMFALCICLMASSCASTQVTQLDGEPPKTVMKAFKKAYPEAKEVYWEEEDEGYEVAFLSGSKGMEVLYSTKGKVIEIEEEIDYQDIPQSLIDALATNYPGMEITQPERITRGEMVLYELTLVKDNISMESVFDQFGNIVEEGEDENEN